MNFSGGWGGRLHSEIRYFLCLPGSEKNKITQPHDKPDNEQKNASNAMVQIWCKYGFFPSETHVKISQHNGIDRWWDIKEHLGHEGSTP